MKKLSFVFSLIIFACVLSPKSSTAQAGRIDPCPPGFCSAGITFVVDQFNFHKPRTDCESRFGICLRGHWEANCVPCWSNWKTSLDNGKVTGWFKITGKKLELHLPVALGKTDEFRNQDMSVFYLDDNMRTIINTDGSLNAKLKGGEYAVTIVGNDYVIMIDIL